MKITIENYLFDDGLARTYSQLNRRNFIKLSTLGIGLSAFGFPNSAYSKPSGVLSTNGVLEILDNAAWTGEGQPNNKQVYVIGAPWCPVSKSLHDSSQKFLSAAQFRWIMAFTQDDASEYQNSVFGYLRKHSLLSEFYGGKVLNAQITTDAKWFSAWNEGVLRATESIIRSKVSKFGSPVLFWLSNSKNDLAIMAGGPDDNDIKRIIQDVSVRPAATNAVPNATLIANTISKLKNVSGVMLFAPPNSEVDLHSVPDQRSPVVETFTPNNGMNAVRVATTQDGAQWAGFVVGRNTNYDLFGWAPAERLVTTQMRRPVF